MLDHGVRVLAATLSCLAISASLQAQDATQPQDATLARDPEPATEEPAPPAEPSIAPTASTLPAAPCSNPCPTSASAIDDDDHSTGWLIIGIGGSVAATTLALGISMSAQAGTNAESRLGSASIAGGITGVAVSLLVGLIAM